MHIHHNLLKVCTRCNLRFLQTVIVDVCLFLVWAGSYRMTGGINELPRVLISALVVH